MIPVLPHQLAHPWCFLPCIVPNTCESLILCLTHVHSTEENEIFFFENCHFHHENRHQAFGKNWILYSCPLLCNGPRILKWGYSWAIALLRIRICSSWGPQSPAGGRGECDQVSEVVWSKHAGEKCSRSWSVTTFLFKIPLYVYPRGNEQMIVGRKAQTEDLGHTQEKSGCRLLRLRIKIDAALPAQGPWDCIFSGCLRGVKSHPCWQKLLQDRWLILWSTRKTTHSIWGLDCWRLDPIFSWPWSDWGRGPRAWVPGELSLCCCFLSGC